MTRDLLIEKFKPSYVDKHGGYCWYKGGRWHRNGDNPALITSDGNMIWYKNGVIHRDNGKPAIVLTNGTMAWYIYGKFIKQKKAKKKNK